MKKGDIVKLKEGESWTETDIQRMGYKSPSEIPELFEVSNVGTMTVCCVPVATFDVVEIKDFSLRQSDFEVVIPAGEPDVTKLLEESKFMATMY